MAGILFYQHCQFKKALSLYKMALDISIPSELLITASDDSHSPDEPEIGLVVSIMCNDERDEE
jgi:hypothetical protein